MKDSTVFRLEQLADEYTFAVNSAVAEDRADLVQSLVAEYPDVAAQIVLAQEAA